MTPRQSKSMEGVIPMMPTQNNLVHINLFSCKSFQTLHYRLLPALRYLLFCRTARHQLIQYCLSSFWAQYAAQALNILTRCAIAADNNRDTAIGYIHALIQYATCDQFAVLPRAEALEDGTPFLSRSLVGYLRQTETTTNLIYDLVVLREENYLVSSMKL